MVSVVHAMREQASNAQRRSRCHNKFVVLVLFVHDRRLFWADGSARAESISVPARTSTVYLAVPADARNTSRAQEGALGYAHRACVVLSAGVRFTVFTAN